MMILSWVSTETRGLHIRKVRDTVPACIVFILSFGEKNLQSNSETLSIP
jgi:hypothetical protein